jgi:hypothetical protein
VDRGCRLSRACEPENRLVAREPGRRWEAAVKSQRQLGDACDRWQRAAPAKLGGTAASSIRALAADLPAVPAAATTTPADRQRAARPRPEKVVVTVGRAGERVGVLLRWVGGAVRPHALARPVMRYGQQSDCPRLVERLRRLCAGRLTSAAIADRVSAGGFRPPKRAGRFTSATAQKLTARLGLARRERHGTATGPGPGEYRRMHLARRLGVSRDTVRGWVRRGWVTTRAGADGHHVIWAGADELRRLGQLPGVRPSWANRERLAARRRPRPRPSPSGDRPTKPG